MGREGRARPARAPAELGAREVPAACIWLRCTMNRWSLSSWFPLLLLLLPAGAGEPSPVNPCCYYPCQHQGICVRFGLDRYQCDCTRTGYSGPNCTIPDLWTWLRNSLRPSPSFAHFLLTHGRWFWEFINATFIRDMLMRLVLTGKQQLPDPQLLSRRFLLRKKFIPDPQGANLMFAFFAQHFTHQFFKTSGKMGAGFTKALGHGVDLGHIYGDSLDRQYQLRLFKDGKLKYQMLGGEMYPPSVEEAPVLMHYPKGIPPKSRMAVGQEVFGLLPGLMLYATLWLREHNRVCDLLKAEHPTWGDEQLFQTARLILIGETIKIVIEEYVQQLSGYFLQLKFDPELLFSVQFQYQNRIALEFNHLYHWHPLMPDSFTVGSQDYSYEQFLFNTSILVDHGVEALVDAFSRQSAGRIGGGRNIDHHILHVAMDVIKESREQRLQPFNEYRKRFGMKPYTSFQEFTGEKEMAAELEELYGDIDALEFYPGLLLEKCHPNSIFGESMIEIGAPFSLKGLLGNAICSPEYWKSSTFGGEMGFNIVKTATLKKLVCLNTKTCPYVSFHVPDPLQDDEPGVERPSTEL
ncbi:prostaglandin G/H synthase 1 isoform X2 [Myotis daubentonii]|uniref:prostaglandin G/H synthase 1 isoform X2 n=1 Tax=Myotis daubentonii TaxID=98922 RepID=UPI0028737C07|nr:prostaglandin G/H synthase 1 isoform X2 [Myotis daubentonii]